MDIQRKSIDDLMNKHPNLVAVFVQTPKNIKLSKNKFLVNTNLTCGQFLAIVRSKITISHQDALFAFVNKELLPLFCPIGEVWKFHHKKNNVLIIHLQKESVYG